MTTTVLSNDFRSTFDVETVTSIGELDDDTHSLELGGKGNHLNDLGGITSVLVVCPSLFLGESQKRSLSFGTNELKVSVLVLVLESSRVDTDGLVEDLLELGGGDFVHFGHVKRKIVSLGNPIDLVGVGTGGVFDQVVNKFTLDTKRTGNDGHDVLRERTSLVCANDGSVGHGLT